MAQRGASEGPNVGACLYMSHEVGGQRLGRVGTPHNVPQAPWWCHASVACKRSPLLWCSYNLEASIWRCPFSVKLMVRVQCVVVMLLSYFVNIWPYVPEIYLILSYLSYPGPTGIVQCCDLVLIPVWLGPSNLCALLAILVCNGFQWTNKNVLQKKYQYY